MSSDNGRPDWYQSNYRGHWDWTSNKFIVDHKEPLRCPYCGNEMGFATPIFYEYKPSSDWYWACHVCGLTLPNRNSFSEGDLDRARKKHRKNLEEKMREAKEKYEETKKLYENYGKNFTAEEKRRVLIETIEEHQTQRKTL